MEVILFTVVIVLAIYKLVDLATTRYERLKAMQKLEGESLVEYLGKAAPKVEDQDQTVWWLMRIAAVVIGVGIALLQTLWISKIEVPKYSNTHEVLLAALMMLLGALAIIIELCIERKLRK